MTPCERYRPDLVAHIYGDLLPDEARDLSAHLKECGGCREELQGLKRASNALSVPAMFPHEADVDWDAFARSTVQRATGFRPAARARGRAKGAVAWWHQVLQAPGLAAAAAGLFVVAGVGLGTYGVLSLRATETVPVIIAERPSAMPVRLPQAMLTEIETVSARGGTQRYLSESRALLLSLLAAPIRCGGKDTVDIHDERAKSLELIRRQRLIADDLERLPLARARDVCRDLERLLLEVASLNDCARADQIRELRDLVQSRQILLRLELLSDEMKRGTATDV